MVSEGGMIIGIASLQEKYYVDVIGWMRVCGRDRNDGRQNGGFFNFFSAIKKGVSGLGRNGTRRGQCGRTELGVWSRPKWQKEKRGHV